MTASSAGVEEKLSKVNLHDHFHTAVAMSALINIIADIFTITVLSAFMPCTDAVVKRMTVAAL